MSMTEDYLGFIGAIIGGAISGVVGIFIVRYTNNLQDKERLKDNVYRKLYGFIFDMYKNSKPVDYSISLEIWSKIEPYELIKMDNAIKEEFEKLFTEIQPWNTFCTTLYNRFTQKEDDVKKLFLSEFDKSELISSNGNLIVGDSNYSIYGLLQIYLIVILNPEIEDPEKLYKVMSEFAQQHYSFRKEIAYLKEHHPEFFNILFKQLPVLRSIFLVDFNYAEIMKLRENIKKHVKELNNSLEKLVR